MKKKRMFTDSRMKNFANVSKAEKYIFSKVKKKKSEEKQINIENEARMNEKKPESDKIRKEAENKKDEQSNENVLSPEEIQQFLVKPEGNLPEKTRQNPAGKEEVGISKLLFMVEKINGKLEMMEGFKLRIEDRVANLNESVGDLRRMIMDREKRMSEIDTGYEVIADTVKNIEPKKIAREFEKLKEAMEISDAKTEKNEVYISSLKEEAAKTRTMMSKIKSVENLVHISEKIGDKIKKVRDSELVTERTAAKMESIFSDITEKFRDLKNKTETIEKVDDVTKDLLLDFDKLKLKVQTDMITKKDLDVSERDMLKKIEEIKTQKIPEKIGNAIGEMGKSVKLLEGKALIEERLIEGMKKDLQEIKNETKSIGELEEERKNIVTLLESSKKDLDKGDISKKTYHDFVKNNKKRLAEVESILEQLNNRILYKKIMSLERMIDKLAEKEKAFAEKADIENLATNVEKIRDQVEELADLRKKLKHADESFSILSNRLVHVEEASKSLQAKIMDVASLGLHIEKATLKNTALEEKLDKEKKRIDDVLNIFVSSNQKIDEIYGKLFSMDKERTDMREMLKKMHDIGAQDNVSERITAIENSMKSITNMMAQKKDVEELKADVNHFTERMTSILKEVVLQ